MKQEFRLLQTGDVVLFHRNCGRAIARLIRSRSWSEVYRETPSIIWNWLTQATGAFWAHAALVYEFRDGRWAEIGNLVILDNCPETGATLRSIDWYTRHSGEWTIGFMRTKSDLFRESESQELLRCLANQLVGINFDTTIVARNMIKYATKRLYAKYWKPTIAAILFLLGLPMIALSYSSSIRINSFTCASLTQFLLYQVAGAMVRASIQNVAVKPGNLPEETHPQDFADSPNFEWLNFRTAVQSQ